MTALNPAGWRPEMHGAGGAADTATFTGNRALMLEEPLIFEIGSTATPASLSHKQRPLPISAR